MKLDKLDRVFSKFIRLRAGGNCQRCKKHLGMRSRGLHCSHWFSRARKCIRWDSKNAASLCYGCHNYLDHHPLEKSEFFIELYGQKEFERLMHLNNYPMQMIQEDKDRLYKYYSEKVRQLER